MITGRRGFITGLASFIAAPAIVRAASLMPISVPMSLSLPGEPWLGIQSWWSQDVNGDYLITWGTPA